MSSVAVIMVKEEWTIFGFYCNFERTVHKQCSLDTIVASAVWMLPVSLLKTLVQPFSSCYNFMLISYNVYLEWDAVCCIVILTLPTDVFCALTQDEIFTENCEVLHFHRRLIDFMLPNTCHCYTLWICNDFWLH